MRSEVAACLVVVVVIVVVIVVPGRHLLEAVLLPNSLPNDVDVAFASGNFVFPSGFVAPPPFAAAPGWILVWCYHHPRRRICNWYYWRAVSRFLKLSPQK